MKKIFTLIAMAMMTVAAQAQVVLVDLDGKEYGDGESFTINPEVDPDWGDVFFEAPSVKNNGAQSVDVTLGVNIIALPENTAVQECFAVNCYFFDELGSHDTKPVSLAAGATKSTATEWQCYDPELDDYAYGTCTIEFTIYENGVKGNVVTVNFVNADPSNVEGVTGAKNEIVATYSVDGQKVSSVHKGIVIEKMNDGSVRKVIK